MSISIKFGQSKTGRVSKGMMEALGAKSGDYIRLTVDRINNSVYASLTTNFDPLGVRIVKRDGNNILTSTSIFNKLFPDVHGFNKSITLEFEPGDNQGALVHYIDDTQCN